MTTILKIFMLSSLTCPCVTAAHAREKTGAVEILPFGEVGKFKMLYDCRQRPQAVYLKNKLYIVYNGNAKASKNGRGKAHPMLIAYNPQSRSFSKLLQLGPSSHDHHYSPIIWADEKDYLHVLFGCHGTPGTHLVSTRISQVNRDK